MLDLSELDKGITAHGSSIEEFNIPEQREFQAKRISFVNSLGTNTVNFLSSKMPALSFLASRITKIHTSKFVGEDPQIDNVRPGMTIRGYFQSHVYVDSVKRTAEFLPLELRNPSDWFTSMAARCHAEQPIVVHVRRGDYAKPANRDFGMLSVDYYLKAIASLREIETLADSPVWFFSDEIGAVAAEFSQCSGNFHFVSPPENVTAAESMILMSQGGGIVISNSTFSWWSAVLASHGKVIAPSKWFKNMVDPENLIPENWQRIESEWK